MEGIYSEINQILKSPSKHLVIIEKFLTTHRLHGTYTPFKVLQNSYPSVYLSQAPLREQIETVNKMYYLNAEKINLDFYKYFANHALPSKAISIQEFAEIWQVFIHEGFLHNNYLSFFSELFISYIHIQLENIWLLNPEDYRDNFNRFLKHLENELPPFTIYGSKTLENIKNSLKSIFISVKIYGEPDLFLQICSNINKKASFISLKLAWTYLKYILPYESFLKLLPSFSQSINEDVLNHPQLMEVVLKVDLPLIASLVEDPDLKHYQALEIKDALLARNFANSLELALGIKFILKCYSLFPIELIPEDKERLIYGTDIFCRASQIPVLSEQDLNDLDQLGILNKIREIVEEPSFSHHIQTIIQSYLEVLQSQKRVEVSKMEYLLKMIIETSYHKITMTGLDSLLMKTIHSISEKLPKGLSIQQHYSINCSIRTVYEFINHSLKRKSSEPVDGTSPTKKMKLTTPS